MDTRIPVYIYIDLYIKQNRLPWFPEKVILLSVSDPSGAPEFTPGF